MSASIPTLTSLTNRDLLATSVAGAIAFPAVLGLGQLAVFKPLLITHGSPIASICGCASVLTAGCIASVTAVKVLSLSHHWQTVPPNTEPLTDGRDVEFGVRELITSTLGSAIIFRALGGRFSSVLPSHLLKPGAFAREWIPVRSTQATERQRQIIREFGKSHGCHSCGIRSVKQFHADHQPPTKIHNGSSHSTNSTRIQRLYPQCRKCSSLQGTLLAHASHSKWRAIRTHSLSWRAYHLFLPIPLAIAYLKSGSTLQSSVVGTHRLTPEKDVIPKRKTETSGEQTTSPPNSKSSTALHVLFNESNIPSLIRDFPLLIIWNRIVYFLDSFHNAGDAFHITLLAFSVVAALGTI